MEEISKLDNSSNYRFLTNKATGKDLFKNRSQDKISDAIKDKIINQPGFKIIGIDGPWGSGKSNLVYQIRDKIKDTHTFFIYDVWGHQEDESRKSILIELTDFIKNEEKLLKETAQQNWDVRLKHLLANKKETTTLNQPHLTVGFVFSLLSIIYIPTVTAYKDSLDEFPWFWKIMLVGFPILIVFVIYIYNLISNWNNFKGFLKSFGLAAGDTFQIYTNKQKEETKIESISENQPSVRDFQNWMQDIDDDLNRKIVIVFDNFDRLPKKHILNIWSLIHIFFAEKEYKNIKVILPFDKEHIKKAFQELDGMGNGKTFGDDYINKTFDIVFRVTLPIMSDWKEFFENQWKLAFSSFDEAELQLVIQNYEFLCRRTTPREIIAFINEIITIKILDPNFKERYISIFILKKDEIIERPLEMITNLDYLGGLKSLYHNDSEFQRQLTAIVYHIELENAVEVIYSEQLREALYMYDVGKFNKICKTSFARAIFNTIINDIEVMENPVKTLAEIDSETQLPQLLIDQAWNTFYYKISESKETPDTLEIEEWQLILLNKSYDDKYLNLLLQKYITLLDKSNTLKYIELIDNMLKNLERKKILDSILPKNISPETFIQLVEMKGKDYEQYKLTVNENELDQHLSGLGITVILNLKNTILMTDKFILPNYEDNLRKEILLSASSNATERVNDILIKLKEATREKGEKLKNIFTELQVYSLHQSCPSELPLKNDLIAMMIAKGKQGNSNGIPDIIDHNKTENANKIAGSILNYIEYDDLLNMSVKYKGSKLFKEICLALIKDQTVDKKMACSTIIENYDEIKMSLDINSNILLKELDEWIITDDEILLENLGDEFICDCFHNPDSRTAAIFISKFNKQFTELDKIELKSVFVDVSNIYYRFFDFLEDTSVTQLSLDVFEECFFSSIKNGSTDIGIWQILEKLNSNSQHINFENVITNFRDRFSKEYINIDVDTTIKILPYLIKYGASDDTNIVFRAIIKPSLLYDDQFVDLLITNRNYIKSIYQRATKLQKDRFKNEIIKLKEFSPKVLELNKILGFRNNIKK